MLVEEQRSIADAETCKPAVQYTRSTTRNVWHCDFGYYLIETTPEIALTRLHATYIVFWVSCYDEHYRLFQSVQV
jgi:hypothetical protein